MKTNHRHYILVTLALLSIVASSLTFYFLYKRTVAQAMRYDEINNEINSEDGRKKYEQELLKNYDRTKSDREKLLTYMVKEDEIVSLIESVERIGEYSKTELELSSISKGNKNNIKSRVNVKGEWSSVIRSLILMENLPFVLSINNISLATSGNLESSISKGDLKAAKVNTSGSNIWSLSFDIEILTVK